VHCSGWRSINLSFSFNTKKSLIWKWTVAQAHFAADGEQDDVELIRFTKKNLFKKWTGSEEKQEIKQRKKQQQ